MLKTATRVHGLPSRIRRPFSFRSLTMLEYGKSCTSNSIIRIRVLFSTGSTSNRWQSSEMRSPYGMSSLYPPGVGDSESGDLGPHSINTICHPAAVRCLMTSESNGPEITSRIRSKSAIVSLLGQLAIHLPISRLLRTSPALKSMALAFRFRGSVSALGLHCPILDAWAGRVLLASRAKLFSDDQYHDRRTIGFRFNNLYLRELSERATIR